MNMRVALGSDHGGYELKEAILKHLEAQGLKVQDFGTHSADSVDYPKYGFSVGSAIIKGEADLGILICGTGQGISITANKIPGIRSAVCSETFSARMAREHNNANVLSLGARVIGVGLALDIVDIFLKTEFVGGRHALRLKLISDIERGENV
jgi:ribose 5-phosphate isomerase B